MLSGVLNMENFTEENYVGLKEYVMDLKVAALAFLGAHFASFFPKNQVAKTAAAAKAVGGS